MINNYLKKYSDFIEITSNIGYNIPNNVKKHNNSECKNLMIIYSECRKYNLSTDKKCLLLKKNIDLTCKNNYLFN